MTRLTRDKIGKLLDSQAIGNFSSLVSLSKKSSANLNKLSLTNNHDPIKNIEKNCEKTGDQVNENFTETQSIKNININLDLLGSDNINHSARQAKENIVKENNHLNVSVKDPLATRCYEQAIDILPKASTEQADQKVIKDKHAFYGNNYEKLDGRIYDTFKGEIQKDSVIDPLSAKFVSPNADHNRIAFSVADTLAGKGLTLVMYLIDLCQLSCSLVTPPVFTKDLLQVVCIKPTHLRNLILRLSEKKVFKVLLHKSSKHAIRVFEFEKDTYVSLTKRKSNIENNSNFNLMENRYNIKSFDVKDNEQLKNLAKPFKNIDLSSLECVGFNETHLIQIYKEYEKNPSKTLAEDIIQHSIDAFAFDLKHNHITESFKSAPAVVLLSLLKKGIPYSSRTPDKFLTPQEEALQLYLSNKQQKIKVQEEQENKLREIEFLEWYSQLKEQQIISIIGDKINSLVGSKIMKEKATRAWLFHHFDAEIWPNKRKQIIEQIQNPCEVQ